MRPTDNTPLKRYSKLLTLSILLLPCLVAQKLKDGEPAMVKTTLTKEAATDKVKGYFNGRNLDFIVNPDTGRILSDWYDERRCGPGFYRCANRAAVKIDSDGDHATVQIQVFERKREAGINEKPWKENSTSKGKQTEELTAKLRSVLE